MEGVELEALFAEMYIASAAADVTTAPEEDFAFGDRVTLHGLAAELNGRVGTGVPWNDGAIRSSYRRRRFLRICQA